MSHASTQSWLCVRDIVTLALGIGTTVAIFTVLEGILLRPLPYHRPDRIVRLWESLLNGA